jgi:hypothetical protein
MAADQRVRLKQWIDSGEAQLHPLAFPQRELWEVSPVSIEDNANHICCLIDVHGLLTERECRAAIQRVVDRQEVLRLSILPGKERPLQMIRRNCGINFDFREVASSDAGPDGIEELATEIFRAPFDLVQGPLYRAADLRRATNHHVLVFAIHHAIADGWSLGVLVQDLFAAYIEVVMGSSEALPPVAQTYSAWGAAERAFWKPEILEQRIEFWRAKLASPRRMWNPPIVPGPPTRWLSTIPAGLTNETRELARRTGVTFFSALFGAFQRWDIMPVSYLCAGRSIARALRLIICERGISQRLTRLPTPSRLSSWCMRSARNPEQDTIRCSKCALLCRTIPCRKFRCRIFPRA